MRILAPNDPALHALESFLTENSHLDAPLTIIPWENYRDALLETLQADTPSYELVCVPGHVWLPELASAGYLQALDEIISSERLQAYQKDALLSLAAQEGHYDGRGI